MLAHVEKVLKQQRKKEAHKGRKKKDMTDLKIAVLRTFTNSIASVHSSFEGAHKAAREYGQHTPTINWSYERLKDDSGLQPGDIYRASDFYVDNERTHLGYVFKKVKMVEARRTTDGCWRLYFQAVPETAFRYSIAPPPPPQSPRIVLSWRPLDVDWEEGEFVVNSTERLDVDRLWEMRHGLGKAWDEGQDMSLTRQTRRRARNAFAVLLSTCSQTD